jgi:hypothetical protein
MQPTSPNHALQRTALAVTLAASAAALPPAMQPARQPPQSLSLGSLDSMTRRSFFCIFTCLALIGCTVKQSLYKRIELPKNLPEATQRSIANQVFAALWTQKFVTELGQKFSSVTQQKLALTDMRWDVVVSSSGRSFFISIGVKDTSGFPEAEGVVDFAIRYAQGELGRILKGTPKKGGGNGV